MNEIPPHPPRANDIWISVTMIGVMLSIGVGVISVNKTLTDAAVTQEARFIRLEETVKSLREDLNEYRQTQTRNNNNERYSNGDAIK
ncbi:hypothetical protein [Synechocystis sp. LKSZ1]|uniref:hypothetical protein n=1 Tax=Synechocystis sp. LKSZ1 TaxID=3144951 RepID=UPI00336BFB46